MSAERDVARAMADYDTLRVQRLTDAQLEANVRMYPAAGPNGPWRRRCEREQAARLLYAHGIEVTR